MAGVPAALERFVQRHAGRIGRGVIAALLVYLWAPIAVLVFMSFSETGVLSFPPRSLSLKWYHVFIADGAAQRSLVTSVKVSVPVTVVTVGLAVLVAYGVTRYDFRGKESLQVLATLPIIVPLVVVGVAMIFFFGALGVGTGYHTVFIAHVIRTIPFATLILIATLLGFDRTLEEASKDLGADELRTFRKVTVPNILPGIIAAALLTFTVSFNEFVYTFFVRSSQTTTLPIYIWERIRFSVTPEVNVMSVVFLVVAIVFILLAVAVTRVESLALRR